MPQMYGPRFFEGVNFTEDMFIDGYGDFHDYIICYEAYADEDGWTAKDNECWILAEGDDHDLDRIERAWEACIDDGENYMREYGVGRLAFYRYYCLDDGDDGYRAGGSPAIEGAPYCNSPFSRTIPREGAIVLDEYACSPRGVHQIESSRGASRAQYNTQHPQPGDDDYRLYEM